MSVIARQSTARTIIVGPILDSSGAAVTGAAVGDLKISKNGGAPAGLNDSATLTHRNTGHYSLALTASDLDTVGQAEIVIDKTTDAMPPKVITVIEEAVYDALFAASATGKLPATLAAADVTGNLPANVLQIEGSDATDQIRDAVVDDATRIHASALNTATGTTIPAILDDTDLIDDATSGLAKIATDVAAILVDTGTTLDGKINTIDTVVDGIKAVTDELPDAGALTSIATASALATVDSNVDAILEDTGTTLPATLSTIAGYIDTEIATIDGIVDAIKVTTDKLDDTLEDDGGTFRFTANALEQAPAGGSGATANEVAEALFTHDAGDYASAHANSVVKQIADNAGGSALTESGIATAVIAAMFTEDSGQTYSDAVAGSPVKEIADNAGGSALTAEAIADEVQTRTIAAVTTVTNLTNAPTSGDFTNTMKASIGTAVAASAVASVTNPVTVGTNNDKTGYGLADGAIADAKIAAGAFTAAKFASGAFDAVWERLTSAMTTAGSIGKLLVDMLNATVGSRSTLTAGQVRTELATELGRIDATISSRSTLTAAAAASQVRTELATELARIDAPTSSRLASGSYTAPDNASIAATNAVAAKLDDTLEDNAGTHRFTAAALAEAPSGGGGGGDATAENQETIIGHLTDIKGHSWQSETDSLVEISDAIANLDTGSGTGANTVTVTVTDGTDPLEGARVRFTQGAESYLAATDASGEAVLALDNATWSVAITKPGHSFAPTTLVVDGDETPEYAMTAVSAPPSDTPEQVTGYCDLYDVDGELEPDATIRLRMVTPPDADGAMYDYAIRTATSDAQGRVTLANLFKGATYRIWRGSAERTAALVAIPSDAVDPYPLPSIVGSP